jgi:hypothetical protein
MTGTSAPRHDKDPVMEFEKAIEHLPQLILSESERVQKRVHGNGVIGRFNTWLAVNVTNWVGSMWCAYVFTIIALIGLPAAIQQVQTQGPLPIVQWVAQTFLQLVLLSVIMVGQNVLQAATDARAEADHQTLLALKAINDRQLDLLVASREILDRLGPASQQQS